MWTSGRRSSADGCEIAPAEGIDLGGGRKRFTLTRLTLSFAPFSLRRECRGVDVTRDYTEESAELSRPVSFTASLVRPDVYSFSIPKAQFLIYLTATVNRGFDGGYNFPSEDVTGIIDFTRGAVQIHAAVATRVRFQAGCTPAGCMIDEHKDGTMTLDMAGDIVLPDADGDRVPDRTDNCRFTANPTQTPVATPVVTPPFGLTLASCTDSRHWNGRRG